MQIRRYLIYITTSTPSSEWQNNDMKLHDDISVHGGIQHNLGNQHDLFPVAYPM
jgi:hypothetical protein